MGYRGTGWIIFRKMQKNDNFAKDIIFFFDLKFCADKSAGPNLSSIKHQIIINAELVLIKDIINPTTLCWTSWKPFMIGTLI